MPKFLTTLAERGWALLVERSSEANAIVREIGRIGDLLGRRAVGRSRALEEMIEPQSPDQAHPRSLSSSYGLNALPLHAELSHRLRPCRYLLLGCIDPGSASVATTLLDWRTLGFSIDELSLLESAPILVRNGRRSFYSTVLSPGHAFLRYDPACLEAVDERGRTALKIVDRRLAGGSPARHQWCRGDILIIDNWRVLHGRTPSEQGSARRLARILINA